MKITESKTYIATPPGATIKEMMEDREITTSQLAVRLEESEDFVRKLLDGDIDLTETLAQRIERATGIPAYFLVNLERFYREDLAKVIAENALEQERKAKRIARKDTRRKRQETAVQSTLAALG